MNQYLYHLSKQSDLIKGFLVLLLLLLVAFCFPAENGIARLVFAISLPSLWLSAVLLLRKRRVLSLAILVPGVLLILFFCLPGRSGDHENLRDAYVQSLLRYEGTVYTWGGESWTGIDCSGLVRNGLINANLREGFLSLNPQLLRNAWRMWWFDSSAKALRDGYKDFARQQFKAESLNRADPSKLKIGDLAVTVNGKHILAYLGDRRWIEADPGHKVTLVETTPSRNVWFNTKVIILRWSTAG